MWDMVSEAKHKVGNAYCCKCKGGYMVEKRQCDERVALK